ncbi:hypothetical protein NC652_022837 [Populus alba x Populus x berolinensis]|nr:hypothetical protein NC652_022462 [Populus alba x Populus x berolinensis]KAJ6904925.1 hypothetical protein NC652_022837 [Populus alba x Populus x berolinensis]
MSRFPHLRLSPFDLFFKCMMGRLAGMTFLCFANVFLESLPVSVPPMCYNLSIFLNVLPRFRNFLENGLCPQVSLTSTACKSPDSGKVILQ